MSRIFPNWERRLELQSPKHQISGQGFWKRYKEHCDSGQQRGQFYIAIAPILPYLSRILHFYNPALFRKFFNVQFIRPCPSWLQYPVKMRYVKMNDDVVSLLYKYLNIKEDEVSSSGWKSCYSLFIYSFQPSH